MRKCLFGIDAQILDRLGNGLPVDRVAFGQRVERGDDSAFGVGLIHTHIERLHHKLAVADRVELVLRVTAEFLTLTAAPDSTLPSVCANRTAGRCPLRS
jgi:hypothetical protein